MKPILAPTAPLTATSALLVHYQDRRSRYRLAIRSLIHQFKSLYPRRLYRFVPVLVPMKWTIIDPGCPDLVYDCMRDNIPFSSVVWELSGLVRTTVNGRTKHKAICLASLPTDRNPPWVCQIMQGDFHTDEARRVRLMMERINAVVNRYRELREHFLSILDHAAVFNCSIDSSLLGTDLPPNPYAGLPDRADFRSRKPTSPEVIQANHGEIEE